MNIQQIIVENYCWISSHTADAHPILASFFTHGLHVDNILQFLKKKIENLNKLKALLNATNRKNAQEALN